MEEIVIMKYNGKLPGVHIGQIDSFEIGDTFVYADKLYLLVGKSGNNVEAFNLSVCQKDIFPKGIYGVKVHATIAVEPIK